jgi:hypothetical protein
MRFSLFAALWAVPLSALPAPSWADEPATLATTDFGPVTADDVAAYARRTEFTTEPYSDPESLAAALGDLVRQTAEEKILLGISERESVRDPRARAQTDADSRVNMLAWVTLHLVHEQGEPSSAEVTRALASEEHRLPSGMRRTSEQTRRTVMESILWAENDARNRAALLSELRRRIPVVRAQTVSAEASEEFQVLRVGERVTTMGDLRRRSLLSGSPSAELTRLLSSPELMRLEEEELLLEVGRRQGLTEQPAILHHVEREEIEEEIKQIREALAQAGSPEASSIDSVLRWGHFKMTVDPSRLRIQSDGTVEASPEHSS